MVFGREDPTRSYQYHRANIIKIFQCTHGLTECLLRAAQEWAAQSVLGRSGFLAAFSLIFLSEIGDKTFFIAALLAMKV